MFDLALILSSLTPMKEKKAGTHLQKNICVCVCVVKIQSDFWSNSIIAAVAAKLRAKTRKSLQFKANSFPFNPDVLHWHGAIFSAAFY